MMPGPSCSLLAGAPGGILPLAVLAVLAIRLADRARTMAGRLSLAGRRCSFGADVTARRQRGETRYSRGDVGDTPPRSSATSDQLAVTAAPVAARSERPPVTGARRGTCPALQLTASPRRETGSRPGLLAPGPGARQGGASGAIPMCGDRSPALTDRRVASSRQSTRRALYVSRNN